MPVDPMSRTMAVAPLPSIAVAHMPVKIMQPSSSSSVLVLLNTKDTKESSEDSSFFRDCYVKEREVSYQPKSQTTRSECTTQAQTKFKH